MAPPAAARSTTPPPMRKRLSVEGKDKCASPMGTGRVLCPPQAESKAQGSETKSDAKSSGEAKRWKIRASKEQLLSGAAVFAVLVTAYFAPKALLLAARLVGSLQGAPPAALLTTRAAVASRLAVLALWASAGAVLKWKALRKLKLKLSLKGWRVGAKPASV